MTDESPSPAAPLQPVKEAGRGTALHGGQQSSPSDDDDVMLLDAAASGGRGAKRSRPEEALQPSSSSSTSASPSGPASALSPGVPVPTGDAGVSPPRAAVAP